MQRPPNGSSARAPLDVSRGQGRAGRPRRPRARSLPCQVRGGGSVTELRVPCAPPVSETTRYFKPAPAGGSRRRGAPHRYTELSWEHFLLTERPGAGMLPARGHPGGEPGPAAAAQVCFIHIATCGSPAALQPRPGLGTEPCAQRSFRIERKIVYLGEM